MLVPSQENQKHRKTEVTQPWFWEALILQRAHSQQWAHRAWCTLERIKDPGFHRHSEVTVRESELCSSKATCTHISSPSAPAKLHCLLWKQEDKVIWPGVLQQTSGKNRTLEPWHWIFHCKRPLPSWLCCTRSQQWRLLLADSCFCRSRRRQQPTYHQCPPPQPATAKQAPGWTPGQKACGRLLAAEHGAAPATRDEQLERKPAYVFTNTSGTVWGTDRPPAAHQRSGPTANLPEPSSLPGLVKWKRIEGNFVFLHMNVPPREGGLSMDRTKPRSEARANLCPLAYCREERKHSSKKHLPATKGRGSILSPVTVSS